MSEENVNGQGLSIPEYLKIALKACSAHLALVGKDWGILNWLIHNYEKIRRDLVWRTATEAIPKLLAQLDIV